MASSSERHVALDHGEHRGRTPDRALDGVAAVGADTREARGTGVTGAVLLGAGPTGTEATRKQAGSAGKELLKGLVLKRMSQPQDMVGACLYLLSDEAACVTGQILNVDGGQVFRS